MYAALSNIAIVIITVASWSKLRKLSIAYQCYQIIIAIHPVGTFYDYDHFNSQPRLR